jgi:hypothetical protein
MGERERRRVRIGYGYGQTNPLQQRQVTGIVAHGDALGRREGE